MSDADGSGAVAADVAIVGAGLAGLTAAAELARTGRRVLVLEKSRGLGGRMATRRVGGAVCDHGAQFFTVRGDGFRRTVAAADAAGRIAQWCEGFGRAGSIGGDVAAAADGHARWRGTSGMTDLPKWIAAGIPAERCTIRTATRVGGIGAAGGHVRITLAADEPGARETAVSAAAAIVTAPVPQALDLFAAGGLDDVARAGELARLRGVDYDPCFALLLVLDRPSLVPPPGAIQFAAGPVAWIADNLQKGVSPLPALTVHAAGDFSRRHFDDPADDVAARLLDLARPWIDGDPATVVLERSLHRWKFALPTTILPEPAVAVSTAPPVVCAGDAFAGPRVEGAFSSGHAAAGLVERLLG
jgi:renalase